jgi:hypothetical protein
MQDSLIARVLRVSPEQAELFRRNKSRIFIGVEGESLMDTILQQPSRPVEEYADVAHRAIELAGLDDEYGDLRAVYGTGIGASGSCHLVTTAGWLKDEDGNVFDLFISLDPEMEAIGTPPVSIIEAVSIENGLPGETPLILSADVGDLMAAPNYDETDQSGQDGSANISQMSDNTGQNIGQSQGNQQQDNNQSQGNNQASGNNQQQEGNADLSNLGNDERTPGAQGQVKNPNDGRLKENRDAGVHIDGGDGQGGQQVAPATGNSTMGQNTGSGNNSNSNNDGDRQPGAQGQVKDPSTDGRLKENIEQGVSKDNPQGNQQPANAMARQGQDNSEDAPRRGRVTNTFDRRLKGNRGMARRPQTDDTPPSGGGASGGAMAGRSGGGNAPQARSGGAGRRGGGNRAEAGSHGTWHDGTPRTVAPTRLDGTARRKPGPQRGTVYAKRRA